MTDNVTLVLALHNITVPQASACLHEAALDDVGRGWLSIKDVSIAADAGVASVKRWLSVCSWRHPDWEFSHAYHPRERRWFILMRSLLAPP